MSKSLYLCYFGVREPLVHTQVIPYLCELMKDGVEVILLTFEPDLKNSWSRDQIESEKKRLAAQGIQWHCLPYHKTPSAIATAWDIFRGSWFTWRMIGRKKIDILHGRVHVPTLMGALARKFSRREPKLLFDIRGFFPEEYTDAGVWPENGWLYRSAKRVERWLLKEADGFVVLTEKARRILFPESIATGLDKFERPVEVIPCCVDLTRFDCVNERSRVEVREKYDLTGRFVVVYVGSLGTWYLADEMADLMAAARTRDPSTFCLVLTQSTPEIMMDRLRDRGFESSDFFINKVPIDDIPKFLSAADVAVSFIKPCFSKLSSSPTKIAEYLTAGLPIITNRGVGDVANQIEHDHTGAIVEAFGPEGYNNALIEVEMLRQNTDISANCKKAASERFDLYNVGGTKYRSLYERILRTKK